MPDAKIRVGELRESEQKVTQVSLFYSPRDSISQEIIIVNQNFKFFHDISRIKLLQINYLLVTM